MSGQRIEDSNRPTSHSSTGEYNPYDEVTQELPLLPRGPSHGSPIVASPQVLKNHSESRKWHRPSYLALQSNDEPFYGKTDAFHLEANTLYAPQKYNNDNDDTPRTDTSLLNTSPFPNGSRQRPVPFTRRFESPDWRRIALHIVLVGLAYPVLLAFVVIARNRTLFWSRFVVSIGCGIIGFALGMSLLGLGQPFLEASTWATLIHQSRASNAPGIRLRDLAASSQDPTSAWPALRLLWTRWMYPGARRKRRVAYDKRPWTLVILFFLFNVVLAASLPFALGRIVSIDTNVQHQRAEYQEVSVKGDLSPADIAKAAELSDIFMDEWALTWTLTPFSTHGALLPVVSYQWEDDVVYFAETTTSQFVEDGGGYGTFEEEALSPPNETQRQGVAALGADVDPGSLLRYPRWGVRIHCDKIPNGDVNIVTKSPGGYTYLYTPRDTLEALFASFDMPLPPRFNRRLNASDVLRNESDRLPDGLNLDDIALGAAFWDNGVAHSLHSVPLTMGNDTNIEFNGWVSVESVLIRLNTTYAPKGSFAAYSAEGIPDAEGQDTFIGYDAAVCVELFEPYVLETYNATVGLPSTMGIIDRSPAIKDTTSPDGTQERRHGVQITDPSVKKELNSTGLDNVYITLHGNSVNQLIKDNGRDAFYVPSPTLVSFTGSDGPYGYTELSADHFGQARALSDASNILPYFAGSADTLARMYPDRVLASTTLHTMYMVILMVVVLGVGLIAGFFVPKLPYDLPHRGFEIYSWLAAFHGEELVGTHAGPSMIQKNMQVREIKEKMGDLKFRYGF